MSYLDAKILEGQNLRKLSPGTVIDKGESDVGIEGKERTGITLHPALFSKHILTVGAIGSGKSNTMYHIVKAVRQKMDENDVMVFFDAKGDYLEHFYKNGDYVISNHLTPPPGVTHWNIYKDILYTPKEKREETIREIASSLLKEDIENSQAPVFGMGARDLLAALLTIQVREMEEGKEQWNHQKLVAYMQKAHDAVLRNLFLDNPEFMWLRNYIQKDGGSTTQSFLVHLYQTVFKIFSGSFGKDGDFSIREAVTQKGGKAIFLEYDLSSGNILDPVYTILLDLVMKEVLGRSKTDGNVYFILDEFPLIPKLNYMDNALNFGRSLGVKVIAGIQNIGQVKHRYGDSLAYSMLSGFGTIFAFRLFDEESRSFVSQRHGAVKRLITLASTIVNKGAQDQLIDGKVIEDWDITNLNVGECIVSLPQGEPFLFYPIFYEGKIV
ncbi:type IV secretory system conjugative DNA transfer family protein [Peribacillus asahii]|uniref:Type IV secretory pathway VirD4 protein n=1 Tax=Peribacillus asahii TaxID=228899 RepID=A0A3Q9RMC2_9BACI|nr:type IV secretion system DNA-binding domain-containing protein [Peribacillus asahii]AZV42918.1 type IV secretory pathway VirD4 protein [Peribacillus asahii]USK87127.1 type IV secretion system DNA-binding domain-containing protein [Peribacillus asahii]